MPGPYNTSRAKTPDNTPLYYGVMLACAVMVASALYFFADAMKPNEPVSHDEQMKTVKVDRPR